MPSITAIPTQCLLSVDIAHLSLQETTHTLANWATHPSERHAISCCSVYTLMQAQEQPAVQAALQAALCLPDGMPLVWLMQRRGIQAERVYGPDLMLALCAATQNQPVRHLFVGGQPGIAQRLAARMQAHYPTLQIAGSYTPPQISPDAPYDPSLAHHLNTYDAQIIWVGLGSPKQDLWMAHHRAYLNAPLLIGVGAAFDFLTDNKPQAPRWMQRAGLEWSFRLLTEPRRLWQRYTLYNFKFLLAVMRGVYCKNTSQSNNASP